MPYFLYTATNKDGQSVTERLEADNLEQAKNRLVFQGYSEIAFYNDLLADEASKLFGEHKDALNKISPQLQLQVLKATGFWQVLYNSIKSYTIIWLPLLIAVIYNLNNPATSTVWSYVTNFAVATFAVYFAVINLPIIAYDALLSAYYWAQWDKLRSRAKLAKLVNRIALMKIPPFEIDFRLACADAAENKLSEALIKIEKYRNNENVSPTIFQVNLTTIYY